MIRALFLTLLLALPASAGTIRPHVPGPPNEALVSSLVGEDVIEVGHFDRFSFRLTNGNPNPAPINWLERGAAVPNALDFPGNAGASGHLLGNIDFDYFTVEGAGPPFFNLYAVNANGTTPWVTPFNARVSDITLFRAVPEPSSLVLCFSALLGMLAFRRRMS